MLAQAIQEGTGNRSPREGRAPVMPQSLGGDQRSEGAKQPAPSDSGADGGHDTGGRPGHHPSLASPAAVFGRLRGLGAWVETGPTAQVLEGGASILCEKATPSLEVRAVLRFLVGDDPATPQTHGIRTRQRGGCKTH